MKFESVEIDGYGSYLGVHEVPFADQGLVLVLGDNQDEPRMDSNGAAKSTIFEAVDWALFGVVPRGDHVDSIINDDSDSARVRVFLFDEDSKRPLVVERSKVRGKAATLRFWMGEQISEALDLRETQALLERELGLDRDVYHAAVFYAQTDLLKFAESTESKRMELLSKILPELRQIDLWLEPAKEIARRYEESARQARSVQLQAQTRAEEASLAVSNFDRQVSDWEANRKQRCEALRAGRSQHEGELAKNAATIEQVRKAEVELAALQPPEAQAIAAIEHEIGQARQNESAWRGTAQAARSQIGRAMERKRRLQQEQSGSCSLCGQPITAAHLQVELGALDRLCFDEEQKAGEADSAASQWAASIRNLQSQCDAHRQAMAAYVKRRGELEGWLHHAKQSIRDPSEIARYLQQLDAELAALQQAPNPVQQQREQCVQRAASLFAGAEDAREQAERWALSQKLAEFWVVAFGPKGLRNYVLDHRLKELTDAANHWVRLLTGGTIWVRFETQKMGRSTRRLSNEINIRVFRFNPSGKITERNYKSWSGGEKRRVGWAIDFGLSRLIAARAAKRYDMLVLDEVFRHVDAAGGEAVVEMLQELRKERSSIFVVEHDSGFQAHFEKRWLVRKKYGQSALICDAEGISDGQCLETTKIASQSEGKNDKTIPARSPVKARRKASRRAS